LNAVNSNAESASSVSILVICVAAQTSCGGEMASGGEETVASGGEMKAKHKYQCNVCLLLSISQIGLQHVRYITGQSGISAICPVEK